MSKYCQRFKDAGCDLASSIYQQTPLNADRVLLGLVDRWFPGRDDLRILEVGTCRCVSTAILATRGKVTTVDIDAKPGADKALKALDVGGRVLRIVGPPEMARPCVFGKFDLAFIDATHNYENVMRDFGFCLLHTERIIFHDYCDKHPGVIAAVNEIHERQRGELHTVDVYAAWDGTE